MSDIIPAPARTAGSGPNNSLTDVTGLLVGHHTALADVSGVTVILCPKGAVAGVDVRGSAPGTRETDLLDPLNLVEKVQAILLAGGSVHGLSAADGVVRWLAEKGLGFPLEAGHVAPIVPGACLFDLGRGPAFVPPVGPEWGYSACASANADPVPLGNVGAGTGARAGSIKGGLGSASETLPGGLIVAALAAVNSLGEVVNPADGRLWEARLQVDGELGDLADRAVRLPGSPVAQAGRNTTIGVVATNAKLTKAQAKKVAQMAQDGLARAIRPAHTMFDGDTIFCLATGEVSLPEADGAFPVPWASGLNEVGRAAADCFSRAVALGVLRASSLTGATAFRDLPPR
ncbi:P1 family peptidase [Fundidesulfovibrio butyratiphilus]